MLVHAFLVIALLPQTPQRPARDARALDHAARNAERAYERAVRRYAPVSPTATPDGRCQERVGRFCLFFDDADEPEPPIPREDPAVRVARRAAVNALRRAFAADPANRRVADGVVRYLVEDHRGREAVSAARAFRWASPDSAWSGLLLGFALHAAGEDSAADVTFVDALAREPARSRRKMLDVSTLLDGAERHRYEHLPAAGRAAYERRLWRLADPLYLLPGNPAFAEHLSRRVWTRLLPDAPWVRGMVSWGSDLAELTMRYGVPVSIEREPGTWLDDARFIERYDPSQVELVPDALVTEDALTPPPPGAPSPLEPSQPRSGHTPGRLRRLVALPHQISRFPLGRAVLVRADAALPLDSAARRGVQTGFFVLDSASLDVVSQARAPATVRGDTAYADLQVVVPRGPRYLYSLEAYEPASRLAGRARYALQPPGDSTARSGGRRAVAAGPALSDIVVAHSFGANTPPRRRDDPALRPLARLIVSPNDTLGLYAEIEPGPGAAPVYGVDLSLARRSGPGALSRAVHWLGRTLGISRGPRRPPRVRWDVRAAPTGATPVALDLALGGLEPGLYAIRLEVTGQPDGRRLTATRLIRVVKPGAEPRHGNR